MTPIRTAAWSVVLVVSSLAGAGCQSYPKWTEVSARFPGPSAGEGRIYFVRGSSIIGAAVSPEIRLATMAGGIPGLERVVGKSIRGGSFFVDTPPGDYKVSCSTEVERSVAFRLDSRETKFIQTCISMGILVGRVTPYLIAPADGECLVSGSSYTGPMR